MGYRQLIFPNKCEANFLFPKCQFIQKRMWRTVIVKSRKPRREHIWTISISVVMNITPQTITQQGKCQSQSLLCSWSSARLFVLELTFVLRVTWHFASQDADDVVGPPQDPPSSCWPVDATSCWQRRPCLWHITTACFTLRPNILQVRALFNRSFINAVNNWCVWKRSTWSSKGVCTNFVLLQTLNYSKVFVYYRLNFLQSIIS